MYVGIVSARFLVRACRSEVVLSQTLEESRLRDDGEVASIVAQAQCDNAGRRAKIPHNSFKLCIHEHRCSVDRVLCFSYAMGWRPGLHL